MHHLRLNKKPIDTQSQKDKFCMAAVNTNNTPYTLFKGLCYTFRPETSTHLASPTPHAPI